MLEKIISIVREAGGIMLGATDIANQTTEKTGAADLVTKYDVAVENFLREKFCEILPEAMFYGEESAHDSDPSKGWVFIVDPIDGTTNFVRGMSHSSISAALYKDGVAEYGVVLDPYKNELFSARRGKGAFLNGKPIHVSDRPLDKGIFGMGTAIYNREFEEQTMAVTAQLLHRSCDFRRLGSAALDLCYTAAGRYDAFFEFSLGLWDFAAGSLILREAGGMICTMEGKELPVARSGIWAANPENFHILRELEF